MADKNARKKQPLLKMKPLQSLEVVYPEDPTEFLDVNPHLKDLVVVHPNGTRKPVFAKMAEITRPWVPQLAYYVCAVGVFGGITATYLNFSERKTAAAIQAKLLAPELSIHEYEDYQRGKVLGSGSYKPGALPSPVEMHFRDGSYAHTWLTNLLMYQRHLPWQNLLAYLEVQEMAGMLKKQVESYLNQTAADKRFDFDEVAKSIMELGKFFLDMSERSMALHMDLVYKGYRLDEIETALGVREDIPNAVLDAAVSNKPTQPETPPAPEKPYIMSAIAGLRNTQEDDDFEDDLKGN